MALFGALAAAGPADWIEKSLSYRRISEVEVSHDGTWAAFVTTHADLKEKRTELRRLGDRPGVRAELSAHARPQARQRSAVGAGGE